MQAPSQLPRIVRFERFELDVPAGELRENGVKVKLQEQPFQVLWLLVEHPGEVLSREELRTKLWPADTVVDFDDGLNAAIRRLRDTLGDSAERPHFIETMARRGYRFIAPVEWLDDRGRFTPRNSARGDTPPADRTMVISDFPHTMRRSRNVVLVVCLGVSIAVIARIWPPARPAQAIQDIDAPAALRVFWSRFVYGGEPPLVVFSNAKFVGRPEIAMHYYDAKKDGKDSVVFDHYTGVGETLAIHELDRVFALLHREIRVKRGSLLELDDAKINNLIFVGSPLENLSLLEIPGTQDFVFR